MALKGSIKPSASSSIGSRLLHRTCFEEMASSRQFKSRLKWQMSEMPIGSFLVLVVVLVLVIEKIKLVKPGANRIEDED